MKNSYNSFYILSVFLWITLLVVIIPQSSSVYPQTNSFTAGTQNGYQQNNPARSSVFRQEIARFQITVVREGKDALPITQVPRVQQNDVLKIKLLDEAVSGIKLDQSMWDWTLLVTFINPLHKMTDRDGGADVNNKAGTVSQEIRFRKTGWYREYSFVVPYDSQPVFFLYPKPQYRKQLVKVVSSKYDDIRKLGEKTIELADAYSKIDTFLNELQYVLNRNSQIYGFTYNPNSNSSATSTSGSSTYNPYGSSYSNPYGSVYNPYGTTATTGTNSGKSPDVPVFGLSTIPMLNQVVEGLAKSFNIQLPSCWGNGSSYGSSGYGSYNSGYNSGYSSYNSSNSYNSYNPYSSGYSNSSGYGYGNNNAVMDFVSRAQCVSKNISMQDFDVSVTRMWQQGGVFLAAELQKKYPQIAYWINIAAAAIDFIVKAFQKAPLRIVPTIVQSTDSQNGYSGNSTTTSYGYNTYSAGNGSSPGNSPGANKPNSVKLSLFADSQPTEGEFVTAYPIVIHKWQANPDPEIISLNPPILAEACLHAGTNLLKSTDLSDHWSGDTYSRDFKLVVSSSNGFRKEFPLRKNIGLGGWELNLTAEDLNQIPKVQMTLDAEIAGTRGFNEIKSPKFNLPISTGASWQITPESLNNFAVGGKRLIRLRNTSGSCRCLQRVIYKPSFGGQFIFEAGNNQNSLQFSSDGREVSFEIDASRFQPGQGTLEIINYGSDQQPNQNNQSGQPQNNTNSLPLKLYPAPPVINNITARRGDREILLTGEGLEQIQTVKVNGKKAIVKGQNGSQVADNKSQDLFTASQPPPETTAQSNKKPRTSLSSQYRTIGSNQRIAILEDPAAKIVGTAISLELGLDDNRSFVVPEKFTTGISRPAVKADEMNQIEGTFLENYDPKNAAAELLAQLKPYPVVSIEQTGMTVALQNILTDYDFKSENISIETGVENATANPGELPAVTFDVLDTNNLRLNFVFNNATNKALSGRRLQFRIKDRDRGDSDWYTIRQTFVRLPTIEQIKCAGSTNSQCEITGEGLNYIGQISVDGGRNWFPQAPGTLLQIQPTADGKFSAMIPQLLNKKFLQIKLRDYSQTEGLTISNFSFLNLTRKTTSNNSASGDKPAVKLVPKKAT